MHLGVVVEAPLDRLPDQLVSHTLDHSLDAFYSKAKGFGKLSPPPGYIENRGLCQQFGISPPSLLCMEPTLWRQQIVDRVVFDLSNEHIQIKLIDDSISLYSFEQCQEILDRSNPLKSKWMAPSSSQSSFCSSIKRKLFSKLASFHQSNQESASDLNQLSRMSAPQLATLLKTVRPNPLTPTAIQVALDNRLSQRKPAIPVSIKKTNKKKRRSSSLGSTKSRKRTKLSIVSDIQPSSPTLEPPKATFHAARRDLYQLIIHLTSYRATLIDFFRSVVLEILKFELPELYSLWSIKSQIESLQNQYKRDSIQFANILHENRTLDTFERIYSAKHQLKSLHDLKGWCATATSLGFSSNSSLKIGFREPELLSSADTSLNETSSSQNVQPLTFLQPPSLLTANSIDTLDTKVCWSLYNQILSKGDKSQSPIIAPNLLTPEYWSKASFPTLETFPNSSKLVSETNRERTPSLSPPPKVSTQFHRPKFSLHPIFDLPSLVLEQNLLSSIEPEQARQSAIQLSTKLAEQRLQIDKLEAEFCILKLLDEEHCSREQFAGISRLSDIITTCRLSAGLEEREVNITKHAMIKGALAVLDQEPNDERIEGSNVSSTPRATFLRPPSKASEKKRRQFIKRQALLATIRRLDCPWVPREALSHNAGQVWPEPIFLKKSNQHKKKRDSTGLDLSSVLDQASFDILANRKMRTGRAMGKARDSGQEEGLAIFAFDHSTLVELGDERSPDTDDIAVTSKEILPPASLGFTSSNSILCT